LAPLTTPYVWFHLSRLAIIAFYCVNEVIELCSVRLIDGVSSHNAFAFYLD